MKRNFVALAILFISLTGATCHAVDGVTAGFNEGGGGLYFKTNDDNFKITLLGYAQAQQSWYVSNAYVNPKGETGSVDFNVTRARLDFIADVYQRYQLLIENDFAPVSSVPGGGPGLVVAQISAKLYADYLKLTAGKIVVPFSTEGYRSSRDFDTINRHMTLNSLYFIPTEDVQYGVMLSGALMEGQFNWFLSVTNGNSAVTINAGDNNSFKQFDAKVTYAITPDFKVGLAGQWDRENDGPIGMYDLTYTAYNNIPNVTGKRLGFSPDFQFVMDRFSTRAELIYSAWPDSAGSPVLWGGFAQVAYFVTGDKTGGFQPLLRFEYNKLTGPLAVANSDSMAAVEVGWQWFITANIRHQLNVISSIPNGPGTGVYADGATKYAVLSELQLKF